MTAAIGSVRDLCWRKSPEHARRNREILSSAAARSASGDHRRHRTSRRGGGSVRSRRGSRLGGTSRTSCDGAPVCPLVVERRQAGGKGDPARTRSTRGGRDRRRRDQLDQVSGQGRSPRGPRAGLVERGLVRDGADRRRGCPQAWHGGRHHRRLRLAVRFVRLTPAKLDRFEPGTDLTERFRDGKLTADIPVGDHIVHYFVVQEGFQAVINGAPQSRRNRWPRRLCRPGDL